MDFFDKFCDPNTIHTLTLGEKMISSLIVTALGMGVTFVGLVSIMLMTRISSLVVRKIESNVNKPVSINNKPAVNPQPKVVSGAESVVSEPQQDPNEITEELVAIITAAVAAALGTQTSSIVISDIRRVGNNAPTWAMMGLTEQINSRF